MHYELMSPDQIRKAVDENRPVVLPIGVFEYHAEHCVVGVDTLLVVRAMEILEKEIDMIVMPAFYYGAASYAVVLPECSGSINIDSNVLAQFGKQLFDALLRIGFRNIHGFIHHQTENFRAGMPTDLAFRLASVQSIFEFLEKQNGEGWWGSNDMQNYYQNQQQGNDPFSWIQIHPFMDEQTQRQFPIDHAGLQETSLMMAFEPNGVDMSKFSDEKWFAQEATKANLEYGNAAKKMILEGMRKALKRKN